MFMTQYREVNYNNQPFMRENILCIVLSKLYCIKLCIGSGYKQKNNLNKCFGFNFFIGFQY